jgi:hypothetical protein
MEQQRRDEERILTDEQPTLLRLVRQGLISMKEYRERMGLEIDRQRLAQAARGEEADLTRELEPDYSAWRGPDAPLDPASPLTVIVNPGESLTVASTEGMWRPVDPAPQARGDKPPSLPIAPVRKFRIDE